MGITSTLFGGGKPSASWIESQSGRGAADFLGNRAGAKYKGKDASGRPVFDYEGTGTKVTKDQAVKGYDFSPVNEAMAGYRKPTLFKESYNPAQFNYANPSALNDYASNQYELGASDIRREGQGQLSKLRESMGVRRPGLLMKSGQQSNRNTAEQLAKLNMGLRGEALKRQIDLNKSQQQDQAGENFKGYQSRSDLEKSNSDNLFRNLQALEQSSLAKIGAESDLTERERAYNDKALEALMQMYFQTLGQRMGSSSGGGGLFGTVAGLAGTAAKAYTGG